jgi:hypothetical protein
MFLSAYHFDGSPDQLLPAYQRLLDAYPAGSLDLRLCVVGEDGLTVLDSCPSRRVFEEFQQSDGFRRSFKAAGLPAPRIEPLGDIHATHIGDKLRS